MPKRQTKYKYTGWTPKPPHPYKALIPHVRQAFDPEALRRICEMPERDFADAFGLTTTKVTQEAPADFYAHKDNGSKVLAVAHLDTVGPAHTRGCHFVDTEGGPVVYSRALDDRLGAYIILDMLPKLDITYDWLFTTGEEMGRSTAAYFDTDKHYDWMIEFDRGGTDVVMYDYEDEDTVELVEAAGAEVGTGIFSDICYLENLGIKGFNWGVGYRDYHGPRAHAYLEDTFSMVAQYLAFDAYNTGIEMPHYTQEKEDLAWWDKYRDEEEATHYLYDTNGEPVDTDLPWVEITTD